MPSITMSCPEISLGSKPTKGFPKKIERVFFGLSGSRFARLEAAARQQRALFFFELFRFVFFGLSFSRFSVRFSGSGILFGLGCAGGRNAQIDFGGDDVAHLFLQFVDGEGAVENDEIIAFDHVVVAPQECAPGRGENFRRDRRKGRGPCRLRNILNFGRPLEYAERQLRGARGNKR